jgi:RNA polymerase sigma-70 factor (ECF subfamily)
VSAALARSDEPTSDLDLMGRVVRGDRSARRDLVTRLVPRVRRICRALMRSDVDADDAAQGALVEILRSAESFAGAGSLERWADRIAARHAMRLAARERRRTAVVDAAIDPEQVMEPPGDAELGEAIARRVHEYLDLLPQDRRELLVLRHVLDYSMPEIATLLGLPLGTVKDRLLAARKHVRRLLLRDIAIGVDHGRRA